MLLQLYLVAQLVLGSGHLALLHALVVQDLHGCVCIRVICGDGDGVVASMCEVAGVRGETCCCSASCLLDTLARFSADAKLCGTGHASRQMKAKRS